MNKIKILHIQLLPILSGVQNVMLQILLGLDKNKYEIFVLSAPDGPLVDKVTQLGYQHIGMKSLRRELSVKDIIVFWDLYKIIKRYKFDIVHTHSSKTGFLGRIAAKLAGTKKIVHTVHGFPFHQFQPKIVQKVYQTAEKIAGLFCDNLVFVNNTDRDFAIRTGLISKSKAVTIYNGIDSHNVSRQNILQSDIITVGCVCRFWEQKNVIDTIKTAIKVCSETDIINFVFVGDGEHLSLCEEMVKEAVLEDRIKLPGWQSDAYLWLKKFDVFLLYSKWEGLPISILEAMSIGLPIVASDINGNNELVTKENGFLVSIYNIDKLFEVLTNLPNQKERLTEMGKKSLEIAQGKFGLDRFIKSYLELYEEEI
jgi:glycosyltransferase involved in cell wall biosynthesis